MKFKSYDNSLTNILGILMCGMSLAFCYLFRMGMEEVITPLQYLTIASMVAVILVLPDFLTCYWPSSSWYRSMPIYSIAVLLLLSLLGLLLPWVVQSASPVIIFAGVALFLWETAR